MAQPAEYSDDFGNLERLLKPSVVAFVGIRENLLGDCVLPTLNSSAKVYFVNSADEKVFGKETVASLHDIGEPIDVVMSFMRAERSVDMMESASELDIGSYIVIASGFGEVGSNGKGLQQRLEMAARNQHVPLIGPNCVGYVNVHDDLNIAISRPYVHRAGGISLVSQSGACLTATAQAIGKHRAIGLNKLVSTGNEAVTDVADLINYFVTDDETKAIGLVIEKIRRPRAFFDAVRRAHEASKPIVVIKLGRTERSRRIAQSHTGAVTGEAWVYEVALAQAGVALATDFDDLADKLQFFDQLPRHRWSDVRGLGFLTPTGGFAALAADLASVEGVGLPDLEDEFGEWIRENVPGGSVANPLDPTGLASISWSDILNRYARSDQLDAFFLLLPLGPEDGNSVKLIEEYAKASKLSDKPFVLADLTRPPAEWVDAVCSEGEVALGNGLRSSLSGLHALGVFVQHGDRTRRPMEPPPPIATPSEQLINTPVGQILPFSAAMKLLSMNDIPVAPYEVVGSDHTGDVAPDFAGPYVVKLANVPHRTELSAVRLNVGEDNLGAAIRELREVADRNGVEAQVAIQPMLTSHGEVFIGIQGASELGPLVVCGVGGVFVEVLKKFGGRMAPFDREEAFDLLDEFADIGIFEGLRGERPWNRRALSEIVVAAGRLASAGQGWIESLDINPLIFDGNDFVAVDALCLVRKN